MENLPVEDREMIRWFMSPEREGRPLSRDEDRDLRSIQLKIQRNMIDTEEALNNISKRIDDIKKEFETDKGQETKESLLEIMV